MDRDGEKTISCMAYGIPDMYALDDGDGVIMDLFNDINEYEYIRQTLASGLSGRSPVKWILY